ncbi:MAG TPA: DUF2970 domain-containing protein [Burkholderiales bacterium]|nr:DUF2970 domain-containing protein [Burkholderiales bacterium]
MAESPVEPKTASLFQAIKMVLSAFVGIRKQSGQQEIKVTPLQVVITGIIAAALFVFTVTMVVRLVLR